MGYYLGVDIGSVNAKLALIDENGGSFSLIPRR
jgi:sugar (pentulose or hexulose) kinase